MKKLFIVKYNDSWADEFNIRGFFIVTESVLEEFKKYIKNKKFESQEMHFGTNEYVNFYYKNYIRCLDIKEISRSECNSLTKVFDIEVNESLDDLINNCSKYGTVLFPKESYYNG